MRILNLFDFDGTLFNTEEALFQAYNEAFEKVVGFSIDRKVWADLFGHHISKVAEHYEISDEYLNKIKEYKHARYPQEYYKYIDINGILDYYYKHNDYNYICSTTKAHVIKEICKNFNMLHYFTGIIDTAAVNGVLKPEPDVFMQPYIECKAKGIHFTSINIFEDSDVGIEAAMAFAEMIDHTKIYRLRHNRALERIL